MVYFVTPQLHHSMHVKEVEYDNDCREESTCLHIAQLLCFANELICIGIFHCNTLQ